MKDFLANGIKNNARYTFRGYFNTWEDWKETANNEAEFAHVVEKIRSNNTIMEGWTIEWPTRQIFYTSGEGFGVVDHPKFAEKYLAEE